MTFLDLSNLAFGSISHKMTKRKQRGSLWDTLFHLQLACPLGCPHLRGMKRALIRRTSRWYHSSVSKYSSIGLTSVLYRDGSPELVNLHTVQWHVATGNSKHFLAMDLLPPTAGVTTKSTSPPSAKMTLSAKAWISTWRHQSASPSIRWKKSHPKPHISPLLWVHHQHPWPSNQVPRKATSQLSKGHWTKCLTTL